MVILGAVLVVGAAVVVPRIAGGTPYTVLTGSMEPAYPPGTLVVVKPVAEDQIGVGDVITYQRESGKSTVVTHRVVEVVARSDGEVLFTTQGDANNTPDKRAVRAVQVKGRLWYSVPYLGYVNSVLTGRQRQTAVLVVSAGLIGYAAFMFVSAVRERRRSRKAAPVEDPTVAPVVELEPPAAPPAGPPAEPAEPAGPAEPDEPADPEPTGPAEPAPPAPARQLNTGAPAAAGAGEPAAGASVRTTVGVLGAAGLGYVGYRLVRALRHHRNT